MIDLAALALGPGIAAFGRPVTVTPPASTPVRPPFDATGVWTVRNTNVGLEAEQSLNTTVLTLGIRLSDWTYEPEQFALVRMPAAGFYPDEGTLWIDDIDPDGQGGATLTLKRGYPPEL
ncbi:hypothetical protein ABID82_006948 [Methylobacterium sp. PvP062]|uniref:Uncharacterized protein n=1 Tax=Methylobacterium radiotolerans TaxID=31998 RepID=A0ABV2NQE3_9HYPH|nr:MULTISPECIES: hypothetical protein [unclassified Methylobacterium]MBP2494708.1 hypothetical protein [Methylobacterium sp. PvP105]MBP2505421.1 hypothetical protein [Methylobacterium sp. PvP109]MCX7336161.1 hypothetical protein [Hyphomicrobiales bacterium]